MVRVYLQWHRHEVWSELCNGPDNGEAFQLSGGISFFGLFRHLDAQQMMRSLPSRTCTKIALRPAVDASVYKRKWSLKSGKAVMGLVVRSVLSRSKAS